MKKYFLTGWLFLSCGLFMGLQVTIDRIPRAQVPGASVIYVPSGKYLKLATFGFSGLIADLVYIWAIQYYSDYRVADRYDHLDHIFSVIAELDPRYLDPYEMGAIIAVYEAKNPYLALKILNRGLEKNPDQWIFPYQAGHYAQMILRDHDLARQYYKKTMGIEGAPPIARRLYADASFKGMDYETAWKIWLEVYETAEDERIRKIASNHLYQVKSAIDTKNLNQAIQTYRAKYGKNPEDLSQLVASGIITAVPKDYDGNPYLYNRDTGEVIPPIQWWKR
ncbi:MAG: tetratricopeptide repeat protein [Candidatus Aminicenantales bacterium]